MNKLVITFLLIFSNCFSDDPNWYVPMEPFRIMGNLYYVGTRDLASYLIVTPKGNILLNSNDKDHVQIIEENIKKLGFKFEDTKILLVAHVHSDHAGGSEYIKRKTGAKYEVMAQDVSVAESGGKTDFLFGQEPAQQYPAAKVERILHDGDQVRLGNTILVAHWTPGHTKGCTTWTMRVRENRKTYDVVFAGGAVLNSGTKLFNNPNYPNIVNDYAHTWKTLRSLRCDFFLGAHGVYFNLLNKYVKMQNGNHNAFIDPTGYQNWITQKEKAYQHEFEKQK